MLAGEVMRARVRAVPLAGGQSGGVGFGGDAAATWPLLPARTASALTATQSSAAGSAAACRLHAPSVADYKRFTMKRVEAVNYAIRGLPADRIRFHLCWGSWHGPHTTDLPMADIVDVLLAINAGAYSFEAANARHEHEWKVWRDVRLPEGKVILPGVVTHSTNVVEHPELVADRIVRFAEAVGRENVVASTDCGLGGRVHPQIAWAKLDTLVKGAELATSQLWG